MSLVIHSLLKDRYKIITVLAQSGMGTVYEAFDETLNIRVAVKENLYTTEVHSRQFRQEATLLAGLRHPNLPRVIDHFVLADQGEYLAMDLVDGQDLRQCLNDLGKPMPEDTVLQIGEAVCDALAYLHTQNPPIIHRDIKPANLKQTPDGQIMLVDFGLAKLYQQDEKTTTGAEGSTAGYSPIEQYGQGVTDPRSDIYALGATLYTLLTCQIPPESLSRAIGEDPLQPISDYNPAVSAALAAVIAKAMAIHPENRYTTAATLREALRKAQSFSGNGFQAQPANTAARITPAPVPAPKAKKRSAWVWLAPVLFVLIASAAAVIFLRNRGNPAVPTTTPTTTEQSSSTGANSSQTTTETTAEMEQPTETASAISLAPTETLAPVTQEAPQQQLAFVSERDGLPQIYLINQDGNGFRPLTSEPEGACQPEWSPDGTQLAYISPCAGLQERYEGSSIFVLTLASGRRDLISTLATGDYDPAWSPDGSKLVFTSLQTGKPQLFIYSFETGQTENLMNRATISRMPAWSPDGSQIVYIAPSPVSNQPILFMVDADGQNDPLAILGQSYQHALRPAWSTANNLILFELGGGLLGQLSMAGGQSDPLNAGLPIALTPAVSSDGLVITFAGAESGGTLDIYLLQDSQIIALTSDPAADYQPAWRP